MNGCLLLTGSTANGAGSDTGQRCPKLSARKQRGLMDVIQVMVKKRDAG